MNYSSLMLSSVPIVALFWGAGCATEPQNHFTFSTRTDGDVTKGASISKSATGNGESSQSELIKQLIENMVKIPGQEYEICKYEVSQALWSSVMGSNPSQFKGADLPVESVSWGDCQTFLEKLNVLPEVLKTGKAFRLPTNWEWETACRSGSDGDYCLLSDGTDITEENLDKVAWFESYKSTHAVGQKLPNAFGLYDMHGNVWEWTASRMMNMNIEAQERQQGPWRSICGGGFDESAKDCRCFIHFIKQPRHKSRYIGLRLAR